MNYLLLGAIVLVAGGVMYLKKIQDNIQTKPKALDFDLKNELVLPTVEITNNNDFDIDVKDFSVEILMKPSDGQTYKSLGRGNPIEFLMKGRGSQTPITIPIKVNKKELLNQGAINVLNTIELLITSGSLPTVLQPSFKAIVRMELFGHDVEQEHPIIGTV